MELSKEDQKYMIDIIKDCNYAEAYEFVTGYGWWSDQIITKDVERENFICQAFLAYYDLLFIEGVSGVDTKDEAYQHLHSLKVQLQVELGKIKRKEYVLV